MTDLEPAIRWNGKDVKLNKYLMIGMANAREGLEINQNPFKEIRVGGLNPYQEWEEGYIMQHEMMRCSGK